LCILLMDYRVGNCLIDSLSNDSSRAFHKYSSFRIEITRLEQKIRESVIERLEYLTSPPGLGNGGLGDNAIKDIDRKLENYVMDSAAGGIVYLRADRSRCTISNFYNAKTTLDRNGFVPKNGEGEFKERGEIGNDYAGYAILKFSR
jgi:hypothetical protein